MYFLNKADNHSWKVPPGCWYIYENGKFFNPETSELTTKTCYRKDLGQLLNEFFDWGCGDIYNIVTCELIKEENYKMWLSKLFCGNDEVDETYNKRALEPEQKESFATKDIVPEKENLVKKEFAYLIGGNGTITVYADGQSLVFASDCPRLAQVKEAIKVGNVEKLKELAEPAVAV